MCRKRTAADYTASITGTRPSLPRAGAGPRTDMYPPPPPHDQDELDLGDDEVLDLGDGQDGASEGISPSPHPMVSTDTPPQRDRVVILGRTRAGKTIYLARLYEQCWKGDGPLRIEAHDGRTHLALLKAVEQMQERRAWPIATEQSSYLDLNLQWRGHGLTMVSLDYPGEVFRRAFVEQVEDEDTRELIDHVHRAAAVLLLIDPKVLATGRLGEAADDDFGMVQALRYMRSLPGGRQVPIALVLTKIDENAELLRHHGKLRGFAEKFCGNLLRTVPGLRVFGVCAVRSRRDSLGRVVPDLDRPPRGLTGPLEYCMERVVSGRLSESRHRAQQAMHERVVREERVAAEEERADNRFWLAVNVLLIAGIAAVGLIAWLVIRSAG